MAYEYERDEWRAAIRRAGAAELEQPDTRRTALGIVGDRSDALEDMHDHDPDEAA